jgi:hypothetical protein
MIKKLIFMFLTAMLCLATMTVFAASQPIITETDKDGLTIYEMSYNDGKALNGASSDTIKTDKNGPINMYKYINHKLSCGTFMNGYIIETIENDKTYVQASFTVTNNPYKISSLFINAETDSKMKRTGYIIVNHKTIDFKFL